jgi:RDD family
MGPDPYNFERWGLHTPGTTPPLRTSYSRASWWRRWLTLLVDPAIAGLTYLAVAFVVRWFIALEPFGWWVVGSGGLVVYVMPPGSNWPPGTSEGLVRLLNAAPMLLAALAALFVDLVHVVGIQGVTGKTFGRFLAQTKLQDTTTGGRPGEWQLLLRWVCFVPFAAVLAIPQIGTLSTGVVVASIVLFLTGRESLPDVICRTKVVQVRRVPMTPPWMSFEDRQS